MDDNGSSGYVPLDGTRGGGADAAAEPHRTPALTDQGGTVGDLPPLCNTGGNSPSGETGEDTPGEVQPAQIALGWLKIRHSRESYAVWSLYRTTLKLAEGSEPCPASKQHRMFGARMHWGGFEYWGLKTPGLPSTVTDQGLQTDYTLKHTPEEFATIQKDIPALRLPDGETVLTDWSDEALRVLAFYLHMDGQTVLGLLAELLAAGATVTRLDISGDFASTAIDPVIPSMEAKDYLPMRTHEFHDSRGKGPTGGRTCYFGTRGQDGGGVFVRFYEKGREQGLFVDLLRYEVELSGDKAQDAAQRLANAPGAWEMVGASILAGTIDFRDGYGKLRGTAHANRDCERSPWWSLLLARLGAAVKLQRVKRPDATLLSMREWVEKGVGRVLAVMRGWMGETLFWEWMWKVIEDGGDRLTERDRAILRDSQRCEAPF